MPADEMKKKKKKKSVTENNHLPQHLLLVPCDQIGHWCRPDRREAGKKARNHYIFCCCFPIRMKEVLVPFFPRIFNILEINLNRAIYGYIIYNN